MSGGSDDGVKLENAVKGDSERAKAQKKSRQPRTLSWVAGYSFGIWLTTTIQDRLWRGRKLKFAGVRCATTGIVCPYEDGI
jgi:hypothetical protein